MKAVVFHAAGDIRIEDVPAPQIKEPTDAIVRLTSSAICGTDLHFVRGTVQRHEAGPHSWPRGRRRGRIDRTDGAQHRRRRPRHHSLDDRLRLLQLLPRGLFRPVRQRQPRRQSSRDRILRRSRLGGRLRRSSGREGARAVGERQPRPHPGRGYRRSGDPDERHLSYGMVRGGSRRHRGGPHGRRFRLRSGRTIRHRLGLRDGRSPRHRRGPHRRQARDGASARSGGGRLRTRGSGPDDPRAHRRHRRGPGDRCGRRRRPARP